MTHDMRLNPEPFAKIRSGMKTIELRLYDDKRRKLAVGDFIRFTSLEPPHEQLLVRVVRLYVFDSFEQLYQALPLTACGYAPDEVENASPADMARYYSPEEQKRYGVAGIEVEGVY